MDKQHEQLWYQGRMPFVDRRYACCYGRRRSIPSVLRQPRAPADVGICEMAERAVPAH